jgi:hypothetical protein
VNSGRGISVSVLSCTLTLDWHKLVPRALGKGHAHRNSIGWVEGQLDGRTSSQGTRRRGTVEIARLIFTPAAGTSGAEFIPKFGSSIPLIQKRCQASQPVGLAARRRVDKSVVENYYQGPIVPNFRPFRLRTR